MLSLYADRSAGGGCTVVVGWVGTLNAWEHIEVDWRIALAKYNVPYFHMKECAHSVGPFRDWKGKEGTRRNFLGDLISILAPQHLHGVGCILKEDLWNTINSRYRLAEYYRHPYVLCSLACMEFGMRYRNVEFPRQDIEFIFERGDPQQGRIVDICTERGAPTPSFRPSRDQEMERGIIQLQSADFAAWELHDAALDIGSDMPPWKYRKSFLGLSILQTEWKEYTEQSLIDGCQEQGIKAR